MDEVYKEKLNPEELLRSGQSISMSPKGYSMYPLIMPNRDMVTIEPVNEDGVTAGNGKQIGRGDIVLFRRSNSILVLHRIIRKNRDGYYLVGDNQTEIEGPVSKDAVCGIVTQIIRNGKKLDVNNKGYRIRYGIWLWLRPLRPVISKTVHFFRRKKK